MQLLIYALINWVAKAPSTGATSGWQFSMKSYGCNWDESILGSLAQKGDRGGA